VRGWGVVTLDPAGNLVRPPETVANLPTAGIGRVSLSVCRGQPQTMYAALVDPVAPRGVQILRSDNAPNTPGAAPAASLWTAITPPKGMEQIWYTNVLGVHPQDPDVVYYGETHLWRSKDGGKGWDRCTSQRGSSPGAHADQHVLVIEDHAIGASNKYDDVKLWAGNDGGVWRSVDGGATWRPRNRGLNTMQYFGVATHPTERAIVAAGAQDNGTQRFLGDGAWELADYGDGSYVAFDPVDPTIWYNGYVSYLQSGPTTRTSGFGGFQVSKSAGKLGTYRAETGPRGGATAIGTTDEALFYAPFLVVPPSGGAALPDIWVGTDRLYYSSDRGANWTAVTGSLLAPPAAPNTRNRGVSCVAAPTGAAGRVYVATSDGRFYRVDQVGGVWNAGASLTQPMTPGPPPPPVQPVLDAAGMVPGSFISAIAAARLPTGQDRVFVGVGRNHIVGGATAPLAGANHLFFSSDSGASFTAVALPDVAVPGLPAPGVLGSTNSVNALVIDPANPDIVLVGCDVGVFQFDASTPAVAPEPWLNGLPHGGVMGLDIVATAPRLLRAATHGRGVWETELDPPVAPQACAPVQVYVRENVHDDGRSPSPAATPDPFDKTKNLDAVSSLDIVVDVPDWFSGEYKVTSTVDYSTTGALDYIGFHDLGNGSSPTRGELAKVHVRVHNRGSAPATQVKVALAWADNANPLPNLPNGFFTPFPAGSPAGGTTWPAIGTVATIDHIGPGEAGVATFEWAIGTDIPHRARLLAAVSSQEDPFVDPGVNGSAAAAMQSRFIAVRDVDVAVATRTWLIVLAAMGLVLGAAAYLALTD
jgi:hypothetical protein